MFAKQTKRILIVAIVAYAMSFVIYSKTTHGQAVERRCAQYESLLRKHKLPVATFSAIMWRESRCKTKAIGWNYRSGMSHRDCKLSPAATYRRCRAVKSFDSGLLQINSAWRSVTSQVCNAKQGDLSVLLIPECNIRVASHLYKNGGIGHWRATSGKK
jgi:hypothetical protein